MPETESVAAMEPRSNAASTPTITIEGKQFGRGRALFPNWEMQLPAETLTLREFLTLVVRHEVVAFQERQEQRQVLQALTAAQIAEGVAKGKVDAGGRPETITEVDSDAAVKNAIQAFEDGLYYVFVNDDQQQALDAPIALREGSRVMFLRLVALAGG
jgi:hypothetical protein